MKYTYIKENLDLFIAEHVERENEDGSISWIPSHPANSDYQAYLKSLDEASTL